MLTKLFVNGFLLKFQFAELEESNKLESAQGQSAHKVRETDFAFFFF